MIEDKFLDTLIKFKLIKKKEKLIIGVSGGPDSLCMLYLFNRVKKDFKLDLVCAHFNHGLRKEADEDEEFVRAVSKKLDIRFVTFKKDVRKLDKGDSLEQTARNLRFEFFLGCSRQFKIKKLALAHTKNDVAETVLMRILRGAALRGLRGILPQYKYKGINIIRPFIAIEKEEILDWLKDNNIDYRLDKTNFQENFFRNKIRIKLLPMLEENFNPNIVGVLSNLARVTSLDYDFIYNYALKEFSTLRRTGQRGIKLKLENSQKQH